MVAFKDSAYRGTEEGGETGGHNVIQNFFGAVGMDDSEGDPSVVINVVFGV